MSKTAYAILQGCDIVDISRIKKAYERLGEKFLQRFLTPAEIQYCAYDMEKVAGHFAAKEAVLKALGRGFWQDGLSLLQVEVDHDKYGRPQARLREQAFFCLEELQEADLSISISHERQMAMATAVIIYRKT